MTQFQKPFCFKYDTPTLNFTIYITNLPKVPLEDMTGWRPHITDPSLNGSSGSATGI